jgi:hypothetical protein
MGDPLVQRRVVEIGQIELARDRQRIGLVDAEAERRRQKEPRQREGADQGERQARAPSVLARDVGRQDAAAAAGRMRAPSTPGMN